MLESKLGRPVINESDLTGKYDIEIKWEKGATPDQIARSFTDSTGVKLDLERRDVMFTVVESVSEQ